MWSGGIDRSVASSVVMRNSDGGNTPARMTKLLAGKWLPAIAFSTIPTHRIPVEAYFVICFVIWPFWLCNFPQPYCRCPMPPPARRPTLSLSVSYPPHSLPPRYHRRSLHQHELCWGCRGFHHCWNGRNDCSNLLTQGSRGCHGHGSSRYDDGNNMLNCICIVVRLSAMCH